MSRIGYYLLSKWGKDEVERRVREEIQKRGLRHKDDLWFELDIKRSTYYKVMARNKPVEKDTIALILDPLDLDTEDKRFYAYEEARGESDAVTQGGTSAYFVRDTQTDKKVRVCFEPLTASDKAILRRDDWQGARFQDAWLQTAEHGVGWKLTLCEGEDKSILGLIRLGIAPQLNGDKGALSGSLLESAPVHQHGTAQRGYKGIGRVLIARLVEESKAQGADGSVRVRPAQGTVPFYECLGFLPSRIPPYYRLDAQAAEILLRACQEK